MDLKTGTLTVGRLKSGKPAAHPIPGDESRALRQIERDWPDNGGYVFVSERGGPMSAEAFRKMLGLAAVEAGGEPQAGPSARPHARLWSHKIANNGVTTRVIQDYRGHKNISHTVVYTELVASKSEGIWNRRG